MKSSCFPNCPVILSLSSEVQLSFPPQGDRNFEDCHHFNDYDKSVVPRPMQFHSICSHCLGFFQMRFFLLRGKSCLKTQENKMLPFYHHLSYRPALAIVFHRESRFAHLRASLFRHSNQKVQYRWSRWSYPPAANEHPMGSAPFRESDIPKTRTNWPDKSNYQPRNDHRFCSTWQLKAGENLGRKNSNEKLRIHTSPSQPSKMKQRKGKAVRRPRWTLAFVHPQTEDLKNEAKNIYIYIHPERLAESPSQPLHLQSSAQNDMRTWLGQGKGGFNQQSINETLRSWQLWREEQAKQTKCNSQITGLRLIIADEAKSCSCCFVYCVSQRTANPTDWRRHLVMHRRALK